MFLLTMLRWLQFQLRSNTRTAFGFRCFLRPSLGFPEDSKHVRSFPSQGRSETFCIQYISTFYNYTFACVIFDLLKWPSSPQKIILPTWPRVFFRNLTCSCNVLVKSLLTIAWDSWPQCLSVLKAEMDVGSCGIVLNSMGLLWELVCCVWSERNSVLKSKSDTEHVVTTKYQERRTYVGWRCCRKPGWL